MTALLDERLRDLATQTHLLETKVSSLGWMAGADAKTLKSMTGLWLDKDDNTWVMGENAFPLTCIDAGNWSITRPQFSTDSVQVLNAAPFRLAKAVEA